MPWPELLYRALRVLPLAINRRRPANPIRSHALRTVAFEQEKLHRLLPAQSCVKAGKSAFFLEPRSHGRGRPARCARRSARSRRPSPRRSPRCASRRGDLVEDQRAAHGFLRRLALPLAELLPIDVGLHRIDLLFDEPADELLDPAVDFAVDERRGDVEGDARGELPQQVGARLALDLVARLVLEVRTDLPAQRVERFERPEVLRAARRRAAARRACGSPSR